jgi:hypothetical protein
MGRRAARFTQADLTRVFCAAKRAGMAVRVDLEKGVAEVVPAESVAVQEPQKPVEPEREIVL